RAVRRDSEPHRAEHGLRHRVFTASEERGAFDVDRVARIALGPGVPWSRRDLGLVAARNGHAVPEVLLELADLGLAADGSVSGHDRVGELADDVEHVGPYGGVALERERRDAEEAQVAREQHV